MDSATEHGRSREESARFAQQFEQLCDGYGIDIKERDPDEGLPGYRDVRAAVNRYVDRESPGKGYTRPIRPSYTTPIADGIRAVGYRNHDRDNPAFVRHASTDQLLGGKDLSTGRQSTVAEVCELLVDIDLLETENHIDAEYNIPESNAAVERTAHVVERTGEAAFAWQFEAFLRRVANAGDIRESVRRGEIDGENIRGKEEHGENCIVIYTRSERDREFLQRAPAEPPFDW